ncbi:MAG: isoprenylcysteine carboxylmethyltransferase family protein [Chloroflexi bacterium]|nr:isoprenylcysteine carboxylmethyltransferase family protein [Chloroflexota bacterium]
MLDPAADHFNQWTYMVIWIILFAVMLLFVPFYKKSQRKPSSAYLAFIIALALEMFGVPLSMYVITWLIGTTLPDGVLYGHTLQPWIGHWGMYIGTVLMLIGVALMMVGWRVIHKRFWSKEEGEGELVSDGIYGYIRHPQYTGFMLITLGMILDWATLPLLIMWPILVVVYYRLARMEERGMLAQFGSAYETYRANTGMFLPKLLRRPSAAPVAHKAEAR